MQQFLKYNLFIAGDFCRHSHWKRLPSRKYPPLP